MKLTPFAMIPVLALAWTVQGLGAQEAESATQVEETQAVEASATIVEIASQHEDLTVFQEALEIAGLLETLEGEGPFTVFVPSNEAFQALPEGQLEWLVDNPEELKKVLLNHVVEGTVEPEGLESIETLAGETVSVHAMEEGLMIGSAIVVGEVVPATNGQIFVINSVLASAETQER